MKFLLLCFSEDSIEELATQFSSGRTSSTPIKVHVCYMYMYVYIWTETKYPSEVGYWKYNPVTRYGKSSIWDL